MQVVDRDSLLWSYLSEDLQGLITDGEGLLDHAEYLGKTGATDFSYVVFPFAKCFEGFLKKFMLDMELIKEDEYYGDDIRIGRILNPGYISDNSNVFGRICAGSRNGKEVAERLWHSWKVGRNQIFHYFPHNFRRINYDSALSIVKEIADSMEGTLDSCSIIEK